MKRLMAILMSCMLMTGVFTSCSDSDDSSSAEGVTKASATDTTGGEDDEDETTEETSEDDDDEEETTGAEKTTEAEKTTAGSKTTTSEKATKQSSSIDPDDEPEIDPDTLKGGDILGTWEGVDLGEEFAMTFKADGTIDYFFDSTSMFSFKNGKVIFYDGEEDACDYTFDGKKMVLSYMDAEFLVLERTSGETSKTDLDGTYKITGGELYGMLADETNAAGSFVIDGEKTYMQYNSMFRYKVSGNQLTITESAFDSEEEVESVVTYDVSGSKLTILDEYGDVTEMKRK